MSRGVDYQQSPASTQGGISDHVSPVERLVDWFKTNGGELSPDVEIVYTDSSGYHCRAARNLRSAVVAKCPLSVTLSYLNLDYGQSIVPHVESPLAKCLGHVPNTVLTYLLLVEQRLHADRDHLKWYPYIACLPGPASMTTPLWFDDEDMLYLAGTNLARETSVKLDQLTKEWNQAREFMTEVGIDAAVYSFEWFRWAATIISSRAFISTHIIPDKETFPILFPVVDILNHSPTAKVEWDFHPHEDFTLRILGHNEIRPGEEIYNNYAPKQNDELLLGYGFCVPDNPVEQFAIKMRLPPQVEQAARSMNLYDPNNIPFDMDMSFLTSDPKEEPEYLRPIGHPFGRYQNSVPHFRGTPPSIIHMFFIRALMNLNMHPSEVNTRAPAPRLVLEIILLLHEAIDQRSQSLPLQRDQPSTFSNDRQRYATIYRDGQAKIIHAIRNELKVVLHVLRFHEEIPRMESQAVIVSTTEALICLSAEFPEYASHFKQGLQQQYGVDVSNWTQYSADISCIEVEDRPAELSVWKLLLSVFAVLHSHENNARSNASDRSRKVISSWTADLIAQYPLPTEAAEMDAELLADFLLGAQERAAEAERAYTWADEVVDKFAFPLVEEVEGEKVQRICMYLQTGSGEGGVGSWLYTELQKGSLSC